MKDVAILLCGKPASGKTTLAKRLEAHFNGIRYGTDDTRAELYPLIPDLADFRGLQPHEVWPAIITWIEKQQDPERINMLYTLTPTHGITPQEYFELAAKKLKETRAAQRDGIYRTIIESSAVHISQRSDTERRVAILDGTFGLRTVDYGREHAVRLLREHGEVYAIQVLCSEQRAKQILRSRELGERAIDCSLAQREWIWDLARIDPLIAKEGFHGAYTFDTEEQKLEHLFGAHLQELEALLVS